MTDFSNFEQKKGYCSIGSGYVSVIGFQTDGLTARNDRCLALTFSLSPSGVQLSSLFFRCLPSAFFLYTNGVRFTDVVGVVVVEQLSIEVSI
jgi:hypothetical protein